MPRRRVHSSPSGSSNDSITSLPSTPGIAPDFYLLEDTDHDLDQAWSTLGKLLQRLQDFVPWLQTEDQLMEGLITLREQDVRRARWGGRSAFEAGSIIALAMRLLALRPETTRYQDNKGIILVDPDSPAASPEPDECGICLDPLLPVSDTVTTRLQPCGHVFHHGCIKQWLEEKRDCPFCRELILLPEDYPELTRRR